MRTLDFYIDAAKEKIGTTSDRELSRVMKLTNASLSAWRTGRSFPDDLTMVNLAEIAGISKEQALLELSFWRASGEAKTTYAKLIKRLSVTAAIATICIFSFAIKADAAEIRHVDSSILYIMENNILSQDTGLLHGRPKPGLFRRLSYLHVYWLWTVSAL